MNSVDFTNSQSEYLKIVSLKHKLLEKLPTNTSYENLAFLNSCRRVISCLVNEQLVASTLLKLTSDYESEDPFWVVLHNKSSTYKIWIPISHKITEHNINFNIGSRTVRFLDPSDLGQIILSTEIRNELIHCELITETSQLFEVLVDYERNQEIAGIISGINNSIQHQILAYKEGLSFKPLCRAPIEYEQAITVGHATHPMHKSRVPMHQMKVNSALYNFKEIKIYFYKVSKSSMNIYGDYERIMQDVAKKLSISYDLNTEILIPVHELQRDVVNDYFNNLRLSETTSASALTECSLRSVNIAGICDFTFKLSLGMVISSAMRTITHWSIYNGPAVGGVIEKIVEKNKNLTFLNELGSIIVKNDDVNISKHFSCIIRENVGVKLPDPTETAIVCAYLTEMCDGEFNITRLFNLRTQNDKENFSDLYAKLLIDSFFDFVYQYGFTFEAHQQNAILKVKKNTELGFQLTGFIIRDFGGILVHQKTLHSKIGMTVSVLDDDAPYLADSLEDVYTLCYHTLFHCHLQQIFRSLDTHDNGRGWRFVREHLSTKEEFLASPCCANFFFGKLAPYKCFIKMKLNNLERRYLYTSVPNLINFIQS